MSEVAAPVEPPRRHRVRTALGVGSLAVLVVMTLLWVRSYQTRDRIYVSGCYGRFVEATAWGRGFQLRIDDEHRPHDQAKVTWMANPAALWVFESPPQPGEEPEQFLGIAWRTHPIYGWQARLPYWLPILIAGIVFTLAFPNWRRAVS